jgi:hypothetical protein
MIRRRDGGYGLIVAMTLLMAGCGKGGPEIAHVSGRVTMDGKPLAKATVVFVPENGRPAGAETDADGRYVLNFGSGRRGAIPGKNTIRIMTMKDAGQDADGKSIPGSPEMVPAEYNSESTLTFTVEPNKRNVADFDLKSGGSAKPGKS